MAGRIKQSDVSDQDVYGLITASAEKLEQQLKETNADLVKQAKSVKKLGAEYDKLSQKGIDTVIKKKKTLETLTKKAINLDKIEVKNSKALQKARLEEIRVQKAREVAVDRFNKKQAIEIKQAQKAKRATLDGANAYKILSKNVNSASARLKRMAAQYGVTDKRTIRAQRNFDRLEKKLRGVNAAARDGRRDVGRYGLALSNVRGSALRMAAGLGLVGGGLAIFRNAFKTVKNFEQGQADLASVLGTNVDNMKELTAQARELGGTTTFTAAEVSALQKELAKLGFDQGEIQSMTAATLALAEATGTDLAEASSVTGSTLRAFGLSAQDTQKVVDVMAKSFSSSSLDMQKFKVAMATVAPVAKAMGLSIEETTALIGTLTDNGVEASTAGAGLRNMMLDSKKAGLTLDEALKKINDSSDKVGTSFELFGKRGATLGVVLAENREATDKLTGSLEDADGAAEKMADTQRNTLGGALKELNSAWEEQILKVNEAGGVSDKLKGIVQALAKNLSTVIGVVFRMTAAYLAYKLVVKSLKLADQVKNWKAVNKATRDNAKATNSAKKAASGFGSAIKAMGITAIIGGLVELALAWWDVASGTQAARVQQDLYNRAAAAAANALVGIRKNLNDIYQADINAANLARANNQIDDVEQAKRLKQALLDHQKRVELKIAEIRLGHEATLIDVANAKKRKKALYGAAHTGGIINVDPLALADVVAWKKAQKRWQEKKAMSKAETALILGLRGDYAGLTQQAFDANLGIIELGNQGQDSNKDHAKEVKEVAKAYKELSELDIQGILDEGQTLEEIGDEEIAQENERIRKFLVRKQTLINDAEREGALSAEEAAQKRKEVQLKALEEQKAVLVRYGRDVVDIDNEISQARLGLVGKVGDKTIETNKDVKESYKELFESIEKLGDKALDKLIENSQKRQELLDDEINASKTLEDRLREGAKNGNAIATESLAAQSDITEQKTREKQKEANREVRLEELKSLWTTLNAFIEQGDNPVAAGGKAVGVVGAFKQLFNSISGFAKGTKGRLGDEHTAQMSGIDGHLVRVDSSEGILTGSKMDRLSAVGLNTTDDIVNSAIMNQQLMGIPMANGIDDRLTGSSNAVLESKLDELIAINKGNAPFRLDPILKRGLIQGVVESQTKNGLTTRNRTYRA